MAPTVDNGKLMPVIRPWFGGLKPACKPTLLPRILTTETAPRLSLTRSISLGIPRRLVGESGHSIIRPLRRTWQLTLWLLWQQPNFLLFWETVPTLPRLRASIAGYGLT